MAPKGTGAAKSVDTGDQRCRNRWIRVAKRKTERQDRGRYPNPQRALTAAFDTRCGRKPSWLPPPQTKASFICKCSCVSTENAYLILPIRAPAANQIAVAHPSRGCWAQQALDSFWECHCLCHCLNQIWPASLSCLTPFLTGRGEHDE